MSGSNAAVAGTSYLFVCVSICLQQPVRFGVYYTCTGSTSITVASLSTKLSTYMLVCPPGSIPKRLQVRGPNTSRQSVCKPVRVHWRDCRAAQKQAGFGPSTAPQDLGSDPRDARRHVWRSRLAACLAVQRVQQNNNLPSFRRIGPRTGRGCNVPRPHQAGRGFCEGGSTSSISGVHSIISLGPGGVVELRNSQAKHSGKQSHQRSPCRSMSSQ